MRMTFPKLFTTAVSGAALAGLLWSGGALAQRQRDDSNANRARRAQASDNAGGDTLVLVYPTGDRNTSSLLVEAIRPAEVPVGQSYNYQVRVTNLTRNLVLKDVEIRQTGAEGLSIEKSEPKQEKGSDGQGHWKISELKPGESKTIKVTALGDQEGEKQTCIQVDYKPTLCVATTFVKPEIQVSKAAPKEVDICQPIELRYTIKNTGSGEAKNLTLHDDLPDGLTTRDGKDTVDYKVGDLDSGQSKDYTVQVVAKKTGEFGSRAVAEGEGDLSAKSSRPTTKVIATELAVDIEGPSAEYVGDPTTYRVRVENRGQATARDAKLQVQVDRNAKLLRMSKTQPEGVDSAAEREYAYLGPREPGEGRPPRRQLHDRWPVQGGPEAHRHRDLRLCLGS